MRRALSSKMWTLAAVALSAAMATLVVPASAASAASGQTFVLAAVGLSSAEPPCCDGPSYTDWSLTGVTVGSAPALGTMTMEFCTGEACFNYVSFTIQTVGGTFSGSGFGLTSDSLTGTVTSATGSESALLGESWTMTLAVSPPALGLLAGPGPSPSLAIGTLTVS